MYEILIREMKNHINGSPSQLRNGLELPTSPEEIEKIMNDARLDPPYTACSYSFRLNELNGMIKGSQPLDKLNNFAILLDSLSELERVKLEGAAVPTNSQTIDDCIKLMYNLDSFDLIPNIGDYEALGISQQNRKNAFRAGLQGAPSRWRGHQTAIGNLFCPKCYNRKL